MKTIFRVLVIVAVCCFASVTSSVIRDGKDEQDPAKGPSCLEKSMHINVNVADSMVKLLCTYKKYKDLPDKEELIQAIQHLEDVSDCNTKDIFGTSESLEKVVRDENSILTNQVIVIEQLLKNRGLSSVEVLCFLLDNTSKEQAGQGNKRTTRHLLTGLLGGPLGGLMGGSGGLFGGLLGGSGGSPGLLGGLAVPLGGLLGGSRGPLGLLSALGGPLGLLSALGVPLGGLLGGSGGHLGVSGGSGGSLGVLGGLLGGLCGQGGLLGELAGPGGEANGLLGNLLGGQGPAELLGGLLGGQGPVQMLTGLLSGQGGQGSGGLASVTGLLGGGQKQGGLGGILGLG